MKLLQFFNNLNLITKKNEIAYYNHKCIELPRLSELFGIWFSHYFDQQAFAFIMMMHFPFTGKVNNAHYKTQLGGTNQIARNIEQ